MSIAEEVEQAVSSTDVDSPFDVGNDGPGLSHDSTSAINRDVAITRMSVKSPKSPATQAIEMLNSEDRNERHEMTLQRILRITQRSNIDIASGDEWEGRGASSAADRDRSGETVLGRLRSGDTSLYLSSRSRQVRSYLPASLIAAGQALTAAPHATPPYRSKSDLKGSGKRGTVSSRKRGHAPLGTAVDARLTTDGFKLLDKVTVHRERSTALHNCCVELLESGCVEAHIQLMELVMADAELYRELSNPQPGSYYAQLLESLKSGLMEVEDYSLRLDYGSAYRVANSLAMLCLPLTTSRSLSHKFFLQSLDIAERIEADKKRCLSEAHCNVGISKYIQGDIAGAAEHFQHFRRMSHKRRWEIPDSYLYYHYACMLLQDTYRRRAELTDQPEQALQLYSQAASLAEQSQNAFAQARAQCDLGDVLSQLENWPDALKAYENYLNFSDKTMDFHSSCSALIKLAHCYTQMGNLAMSVDQLKCCDYIGSSQKIPSQVVRACFQLGYIHMTMNSVDQSLRHFARAYDHVLKLGHRAANSDLAASVAVMVGVAKADRTMPDFARHVYNARASDIEALLGWKNQRHSILQKM